MIKENIKNIRKKIDEYILKSDRKNSNVKLMVVSKFQTIEKIECAINAGQFLFGENRVQEIVQKFPEILKKYPNVELHMIGNLQRNKVKQVLPFISAIQSVDRISLLDEIIIQAEKLQLKKRVQIYFEIHTAEETKSGFQNIEDLIEVIEKSAKSSYIKPVGFMTMAPFIDDEKVVRASFQKLKDIAKKCQEKFPELELNELSMGMSGDFHIAIEEGSTLIRIGTAIFGQ